jgi:hypothetical protein
MAEKDYSGTPLPSKLGIKPGGRVALVGAPEGFRGLLVPWPDGAELVSRPRKPLDVAVIFSTRGSELRRRFASLARALDPAGGLWVGWPKKAARMQTDLDFETVQQIGLEAGLVDNKSASLDEAWQGLRFVVRLRDRAGR